MFCSSDPQKPGWQSSIGLALTDTCIQRLHVYDNVPVRRLLSDCADWREDLRPTFSKLAGWLPLLPHIKSRPSASVFGFVYMRCVAAHYRTFRQTSSHLSSGLMICSVSVCAELKLRLFLDSVCFSAPAPLLLPGSTCRSVMTRRGRVRVMGWKITAPEAWEIGWRPPT